MLREKRPPLLPDLTDAPSLLTKASLVVIMVEFRGLSLFEPGILDLSDLNDLDESLVSDLLNDGYDCRPPSGLRSTPLAELPGLEVAPSLDG